MVTNTITEKDRVMAEKEQAFVEADRVIGEQNGIIASLDKSIDDLTVENTTLKNDCQALRDENTALVLKSSHIETCLKTVGDLKVAIQERDAKIAELTTVVPVETINKKVAKVKSTKVV